MAIGKLEGVESFETLSGREDQEDWRSKNTSSNG